VRAWPTHAALLLVQAAFASQAVEGKIAMGPVAHGGEGIRPQALAMARMLGAAIFFQLLAFAARSRARRERGSSPPREAPSARDHLALAGLSILGIALNQTLFLVGLRLTTATSASLLGVTIPVFTTAFAVLLRQERASPRLVLGLGLAVAGVLFLTGFGAVDRGALVITVNSISYSAYLVLSRGVLRRFGAFTVITWVFTWGAILFAPVGASALARAVPALTPRGWLLVAYIVAMPTIVAYLANAWALGRSTPSVVTAYIYVQPVIAAGLAWIQLGEPVSRRIVVAAAFIALGVGIVTTRPVGVAPPPLSSAAKS